MAEAERSPVVRVWLCAPCAGYAPISTPAGSYQAGHCDGCRSYSRELHKFQALIMSAASGGCACDSHHFQVCGDLPTRESAYAVLAEVRTRPPQHRSQEGNDAR